MRRFGVMGFAAMIGLSGCSDPVRESAIEALGGEVNGVEEGPLHRPGQPCVLCHDGSGPGSLEFSLAGTVFQTPADRTPLADVIVRFIDSTGRQYATATNCAGNFFVTPADYDPKFPVWVKMVFAGVPQQMGSPIYREGSCAACHGDPPGPEAAGHVYFSPIPGTPFPPGCR